MTTFHRNSANPAGYDPFPSGYDFINNPAANSPPGLGSPALFDGKKSGGPNDGTYFRGFGEDATSLFSNRGLNALADNCDTLDNYLRRPIAIPTRTNDAVDLFGATSAITLPGPPVPGTTPAVYLGTTGMDSFPEGLTTLFDVLDINDDEIVDPVTGVRVVVTSITSTNGGDAIGSGFALGTITLHLTPSIPTGVHYRVYYGEKGNLAQMPPDALTIIKVRGAMEVPALVEDIFKQITNPGTVPETVTAVVASVFSTPTNGRLPQTAFMTMSVDPSDSGAAQRDFEVWTRANTGNAKLIFDIKDDPTSVNYPGILGWASVPPGFAVGNQNGTLYLFDANTVAHSGTHELKAIPLTSQFTAAGDQNLRLFEVMPSSGSLFTGPSIAGQLNARWTCTCGDGVISYGDFTGANALESALSYISTNGVTSAHILMKKGNYTLTSNHSMLMANLVIEGPNSGSVIIQSTSNTGFIELQGTPSGILYLKGLTFTKGVSGQNQVVETVGNSSLDLEDVYFLNCGVSTTDLIPAGGSNTCFFARRCTFIQTTAGQISVDFQLGSSIGNTTRDGFVFENCYFSGGDETQTVRFMAYGPGINLQTVRNVFFRRCEYILGGTATTSSHGTHNTGVLEINPNGSSVSATHGLLFNDITFEDCKATVTTSAANGVLARIMPVALGDNTYTHLAFLQNVTIRGGVWSAGGPTGSAPTAISPFFIAAQTVDCRDVTFIGNSVSGGGPSSEDQNTLGTAGLTTQFWSQFIFAPGASANSNPLSSGLDDVRLTLRNVTFRYFTQSSGSGDAWFYLPGTATADIDSVRFRDYIASTGTVPNSRLQLTLGDTFGCIRGVSVLGGNATANTNAWGGGDTGTGGIIVFNAKSGGTHNRAVQIERMTIDEFVYGGSTLKDDGIVVCAGGTDLAYSFTNCQVHKQSNGFVMWDPSLTGPVLDNFSIIGGDFNTNDNNGVFIRPSNIGHVLITKIRACFNNQLALGSATGVFIKPHTWQNSFSQGVIFTDNYLASNPRLVGGNEVEACFLTTTAGDHVKAIITGNVCVSGTGGFGGIEVDDNVGGALPSPAAYNSSVQAVGVDTGFGTSPNYVFANGSDMTKNSAFLVTP